MLTAADLNKTFDDYADKLLVPVGFKKSGIHYYKKADGQFYAIIKDTSRGYFMDYYLTYSHIAADKQFELLQKKPSVMLKDYPVSIAVNDLKIVYNNNDRLIDSPFYFFIGLQFRAGQTTMPCLHKALFVGCKAKQTSNF